MILTPTALLARIYDEEFGFQPTNKSVKPVHVANGVSRWISGRTYQTTALAHALRRFVKDQRLNVVRERHPDSEILDSYSDAFEPKNGSSIDRVALSELRTLALAVFGADDAVFDDPDKSSYTLSNARFASRDPSDQRAGLFLVRLVTAGVDGRAAGQLREILSDDTDPWTVLALPLLNRAHERVESHSGSTAESIALSEHLFEVNANNTLRASRLAQLREAFDRLAAFESGEGSKLNSLRRMVLFGCFVIQVHMLSRWSDRFAGAPRPPILLDMFDGDRVALRDASRATLRASGDAVEGLLFARVREVLAQGLAETDGFEELLDTLREVSNDAVERFEAHRSNEDEYLDRLAEAYVDVGLEELKAQPIEFMTELGRRAGYMTPWSVQGRGGKLQKRYGIKPEFLEVLVTSIVDPGDELEFGEFLDQLHLRYGVLVGRPGDDPIIRRCNVHEGQFGTPISIQEEDLRANVIAFRSSIESIGFAKTYADGRTLISTDLERVVRP